MHMGNNNRNFNYEMNGYCLEAVEEEKDLEVIDNLLKFSK